MRHIAWPGFLLAQPGTLVTLTLDHSSTAGSPSRWACLDRLTLSRGAARLAQSLGDSTAIVQLRNEHHCCSIWDLQVGNENKGAPCTC